MEGAEPLPRRSVTVLPKLTTASPLITKRAAAPKKYSKNKFYHNIVADSLPAAGTCHDRGHSSMTSVPATINTRPRADFFVSFSWKTR